MKIRNVTLGLAVFPTAFPFKNFDPLTIGAIAAAAGSGLASIFGSASTNKANERIARETNATNMAMNQNQIEAQKQQWQRETVYNSPSQQVMRLRAAGINPQALVSSGNAQPMQFNSPTPMQSYQRQNIIPENLFSDPYNAGVSAKMAQEELTQKKRENYMLGVNSSFAIQKEILSLEKQKREVLLSDADRNYKNAQIRDINDQIDLRRKQQERQARIDEQSLENLKADYDEKRASTSRQNMLALAQKKHWSQQDAIDWYNASTSRMEAGTHEKLMIDTLLNSSSARQTANRVRAQIEMDIKKGRIDLKHYDSLKYYESEKARYEKDIAKFSRDEKEAIAAIIALQLKKAYQADNSVIAAAIRHTLGIDLTGLLNGSLGAVLNFIK